MAQPSLRLALQVTRPARSLREPSAFFHRSRNLPTLRNGRTATARCSEPTWSPSKIYTRHLSSTAALNATVVRKNPRIDEDGHDMTVEISDRAAKRLKQITTSPPQKNTLAPSTSSSDSHLRVTVTSGGCHGFQYLMSLEGPSKIDQEEDTIFAAEDGGEGQAVVVMDEPSLELLKGSTIDFTQELIGSQFKIVGNPRAKSSCGCGTSFDIE